MEIKLLSRLFACVLMRAMRAMAGKPGTKRKKAYTVADVDGFRDDLAAILEKFDAFSMRFRDAKLGETRLAIDGADGIRQGFAQLHRWLSKMSGELDAETSPQRGEWVADLPESGPNTRISGRKRRRSSDKNDKAEVAQPAAKQDT